MITESGAAQQRIVQQPIGVTSIAGIIFISRPFDRLIAGMLGGAGLQGRIAGPAVRILTRSHYVAYETRGYQDGVSGRRDG